MGKVKYLQSLPPIPLSLPPIHHHCSPLPLPSLSLLPHFPPSLSLSSRPLSLLTPLSPCPPYLPPPSPYPLPSSQHHLVSSPSYFCFTVEPSTNHLYYDFLKNFLITVQIVSRSAFLIRPLYCRVRRLEFLDEVDPLHQLMSHYCICVASVGLHYQLEEMSLSLTNH